MRGGWFHSGDAAVVHPDGYAEIRDRIKDVIISGGENISSVEVEGVLLQHAAVQEVAVVGMPDAKWGEAPHAFVVLRAGATVDEGTLREFVRARLAHFKCPRAFHFVDELPKTATGKMQKFVLRGRRVGDRDAVGLARGAAQPPDARSDAGERRSRFPSMSTRERDSPKTKVTTEEELRAHTVGDLEPLTSPNRPPRLRPELAVAVRA